MLFIDESAFALVSQLYPDGSVHKPATIELNGLLKMFFVLTQPEADSLRKPFLVFENPDQK
jgi:hypothetical protein